MDSTKETKTPILEHIEELRVRLIYVMVTVGVIALFCFMFNLRKTELSGFPIYYPYPDIFNSIAAVVFKKLQADLLPEGVQIIQTAPAQALLALLYISLFLGVVFGMPMIVYQTVKFVAPALYPHEKKMILRMILPSTALFVSGCIFSYYLLTPFTLYFLYRYGFAAGIVTFLTMDEFISFVVLFTSAFGLAFQLPIIMFLLSEAEVVEPEFWKENFRIAVFVMFLFGAIITPDGSGVTMCLVALPMIGLYALGYFLIQNRRTAKHKKQLIFTSKNVS